MSLICGFIYQNKCDYLNKMLIMCPGNVRETSGLLRPLYVRGGSGVTQACRRGQDLLAGCHRGSL